MKKNNPHVPILMREAAGTEPRVFARYGTPILCGSYTCTPGGTRANPMCRIREGKAGVAVEYDHSIQHPRGTPVADFEYRSVG